MSYESNLIILQAFLKRLAELPEGEEFVIPLPPEEITGLRSFLYEHWGRTDQKGIFRIERKGEGVIKILKRRTFVAAADSLSQLASVLGSPAKARRTFPGFQGSSRAAPTESPGAARPQPKNFKDLLKKKYGKEPAEEQPEEGAGSGIEFYNKHGADKTWPEIHKLVSTAQAAGELSDPEANQALTEWQRLNPEFKPSSKGSDQK